MKHKKNEVSAKPGGVLKPVLTNSEGRELVGWVH